MLGSRKLLIFGIVSALVLSLVIVGAFAAEPEDVKALGDGGFVKTPAPADVVVPNNPFKTTYIARSNNYADPSDFVSYTASSPLMVHFFYYKPNNQNAVQLEFSEDVPFYINPGSGTGSYSVSVNGVTYPFNRWDNGVAFVFGSYESFDVSFYQFATLSSSAGYLNPLPIFNSILGIGTALVSFVIARPIVLIPIVAMILVLSYGVIRRLIKGV